MSLKKVAADPSAVDLKKIERKRLGKRILSNWQLYAMLVLPVAYIIIFNYVPMLGAQIAFKRYNATGGIWGSPWVGLANFKRFFSYYNFGLILKNTIVLSVYHLYASFPLSVIFALALNLVRNKFYKRTVQTITYLTHFISTVVLVGMMMQFFNTRIGMFPKIVQFFGGEVHDLFGDPKAFSHLYVWSDVWKNMGWGSIIYLSALSAVDPELHEAAIIDGASRFKRILYIDIPTILPTIVVMLILNMGKIMSIGFEKVYMMQNDLNIRASEIISTYTYKVGLGSDFGVSDFSYGAAISLFNSVINITLLCTVNAVSRRVTETSLW
ncbi:MAG: sugar ABC transporter permease [Ruminococcaceae bacterium]|nr:sugar ABC transporter permease [Oscillospiraceae bacterium]